MTDLPVSRRRLLATTDFAAGWSLRWTQTYHPGFELQLSTPGMTFILWPWTGGGNQQRRLLPNPDGSFRLSCVGSGKVLDSPGGSGQGAALVQWADNGGTSQRWTLVPATTSGYHRLVNVGNGQCVGVEGGSTADGASVVQRPVSGEPSQEGKS